MAGPKVKLKDQLGRVVRLGGDSTGATVGKDLRWPDGSLVKSAEIRNPSTDGGGTGPAATLWKLIREVPANLAALAKVSAAGLLIRRSNGAIEAGTVTTDDLPEGAENRYFPEAPEDGKQYARRNGSWAEVTGGGGGSAESYGRGFELGSLLHMTGSNDSTTFTDETGKVWTAHGGAKISNAQTLYGGNCAYFDGVDDYISTPSHPAFDLRRGALLVELSVFPTKPSDGTNPQNLVHYGEASTYFTGWILQLRHPNNTLRVQRGTGSSEITLDTGVVIPLNAWTDIAVCYLGPDRGVVISVNGEEVGFLPSNTPVGTPNPTARLDIARDMLNPNRNFRGYMREFRVTRGAGFQVAPPLRPTGPWPNP